VWKDPETKEELALVVECPDVPAWNVFEEGEYKPEQRSPTHSRNLKIGVTDLEDITCSDFVNVYELGWNNLHSAIAGEIASTYDINMAPSNSVRKKIAISSIKHDYFDACIPPVEWFD
jgi:hypothetical protein